MGQHLQSFEALWYIFKQIAAEIQLSNPTHFENALRNLFYFVVVKLQVFHFLQF